MVVWCVDLTDAGEASKSRQWWREQGFTLRRVCMNARQAQKTLRIHMIPAHYVIGPDGTVRHRDVGYDEPALREALDMAAGE